MCPLSLRIASSCLRGISTVALLTGLAVTAHAADVTSADPLANWEPLYPDTIFQDFFDPRIPPPNGSSGAPRQGWLNTVDGFFTNEAHLAFDWSENNGDDFYRGIARLNHPWSQRFWTGLEVPFVVSDNGDTNFGNVSLTNLVMLVETQDLALNFGSGVTFPTGGDNNEDLFGFTPQINLWTDIGNGFSFRSGGSLVFDDQNGYQAFRINAAIGQTLTPPNEFFGDFTWYVSGNLVEPEEGPAFLSITPGIRFHTYDNLFFLAGVEVPVINTDDFYDQRVFVQLVKGF